MSVLTLMRVRIYRGKNRKVVQYLPNAASPVKKWKFEGALSENPIALSHAFIQKRLGRFQVVGILGDCL